MPARTRRRTHDRRRRADHRAGRDRVWNLFLGLGLVVLLLVAGLMLWVIVRYRKRPTDGPLHLPPQKHYNIPMEVTYVVILLAFVLRLLAISSLFAAATALLIAPFASGVSQR